MMLYLLIALVVFLVLAVMKRPDTFRYERSIHIAAPPETVFPLVVDFHQWRRWSPFEDIDPNNVRTYGGAPEGVGAVYGWSGNSQAGEGRMEIVAAEPPSLVRIQQNFTRPFKMDSTVEFLLKAERHGTMITWAMLGRNSAISKVMGLFMNMEKMIGKEFDKGLARLKTEAEAEDRAQDARSPTT